MTMLVDVVLAAALLGLLGVAFVRPWEAVVVLVGLLPLNGLLLHVGAQFVGLTGSAQTMLAAWHDALAGGVILAAAADWVRSDQRRVNRLEVAVAAVMIGGLMSALIAPHLTTAVYSYRTLYEPMALMVALTVLASARGVPDHAISRIALAMVIAGVVASGIAVWQVYIGGLEYLKTFYSQNGQLPVSYFAAAMGQPRAISSFTSPNEFGAYLVIVLTVLWAPGVVRTSDRLKSWSSVAIGFALLLTISRSAWLSLTIALLVLVALASRRLAALASLPARISSRTWWSTFGVPGAAFVLLVALFVTSSGLPNFVKATLGGEDRSAVVHINDITSLLGGAITTDEGAPKPEILPLGMGLGTAGPKSARFGEQGSSRILNSEIWYVNYLLQAGYLGLAALLGLGALVVAALWRRRSVPLPRHALAVVLGLAAGALFIPVLDEPAVAVPLWIIIGLSMSTKVQPRLTPSPSGSAS